MVLTLSRTLGVIWRSYYYAGSARIAMRQVNGKMLTDYYFTGQLV